MISSKVACSIYWFLDAYFMHQAKWFHGTFVNLLYLISWFCVGMCTCLICYFSLVFFMHILLRFISLCLKWRNWKWGWKGKSMWHSLDSLCAALVISIIVSGPTGNWLITPDMFSKYLNLFLLYERRLGFCFQLDTFFFLIKHQLL